MSESDNQSEPVGEQPQTPDAEDPGQSPPENVDVVRNSVAVPAGEGWTEILMSAYTETGLLYRRFSGRRGRLFAGYLVTVAAVLMAFGWAWSHSVAKPIAWIAMAAGCLLTLVFWALERRTRHVSFACINAGGRLEIALGLRPGQGVFTSLAKLPSAEPAPGRTFDWMYLVAALGFLVGTLYSLAETS